MDGQVCTVDCSAGEVGVVLEGNIPFTRDTVHVDKLPPTRTKIMMNLANPHSAFGFSRIPNAGIGLARLEFIINSNIGMHPRALLEFASLPAELQTEISKRCAGYADPVSFYVEKLVEGITTLACGFRDKPVIVRLSDFKSNEYANLLGGHLFEPSEENPMIGFRGASRYIADSFKPCFELECRALKKVREELGFTNVEIMIPFVRTLDEASQVIDLLTQNGLRRGEQGLRVIMMCEIPSNALLADQFLDLFDGFSIGSNDLTQLTLGLDRDSALVARSFDERNPAVKRLLSLAISGCRERGKYIGICGQGPSDYPDLAEWLMKEGIGSISLNPDTVVETWHRLAKS
jgi:pyruvate,water dikinase